RSLSVLRNPAVSDRRGGRDELQLCVRDRKRSPAEARPVVIAVGVLGPIGNILRGSIILPCNDSKTGSPGTSAGRRAAFRHRREKDRCPPPFEPGARAGGRDRADA